VSSVVTYWSQEVGGAVNVILQRQLWLRVENALVSYVSYLLKTLWPARLAVFYPLPRAPFPLWQLAAAALLLTGATLAVVRLAGKRPYLAMGWLWYLGTLVPVIGLVQVGGQAMADRYMYLPLVGLAVMAAWTLAESGRGPRAGALVTATAACLVALAVTARIHVGEWRDSPTLFRRALEVTEGNYIAHANLGRALVEAGMTDDGIAHLRESLAITVDPGVLSNLGTALMLQGRSDEALLYFARALDLGPSPAILTNIGMILLQQGDLAGAAARFREALRLEAGHAVAHNNLGVALLRMGRREEAIAEYREAIRLQPQYPAPIINLGDALLAGGESREAADLYLRVLQFDPGNADARARLEKVSRNKP